MKHTPYNSHRVDCSRAHGTLQAWTSQNSPIGTTRTWNPPTKGEQVVLLCPSGDPSNGILPCAIPSAANDVPSHSPKETITLAPDGALTKYDHAADLLTLQGVKTVFLEAAIRRRSRGRGPCKVFSCSRIGVRLLGRLTGDCKRGAGCKRKRLACMENAPKALGGKALR